MVHVMYHNKRQKMKNKLIAILFISLTFVLPANAITVVSGARSWWGYTSRDTTGSAGDFMLAGSLGKGSMHGTFSDEWAVVGVIAQKIVEHGGYFCPYQIQCANKNRKAETWTMYYYPNGFGSVGCSWVCEPGYAGANCLSQSSTPSVYDTKIYGTGSGQKFGGLSLKTTGGSADQKESEVSGFDQFGSDPESDILLGVLKFGQHGVVAGPVKVTCGRSGYKDAQSYVAAIGVVTGSQKLLCANGYKANDTGSDCVPISADVAATQTVKFCDGFTQSGYKSDTHSLEQASGCSKYFCTDKTKAFPKTGDFSCVDCSASVKGGVSKINGQCVQCQTSQYFDSVTSTCKSAIMYTKIELQYGRGKARDTAGDLMKQCWTLAAPADYKKCVMTGIVTPATIDITPTTITKGLPPTVLTTETKLKKCLPKAITNGNWNADFSSVSITDDCKYTEIDGIICNSGYTQSGSSCVKSKSITTTTITTNPTTTTTTRNCTNRMLATDPNCVEPAL